ncbi:MULTISPECIES: nucleic acid/nucleotide deaminase domain-containing protein [unclassified Microbacterium]|uniref:nucleic acid/nucleotide deaminase domain-containing protein n=1 Tax=unclassified Microbacterium TaxID=2609290 RepID=UPI0027D47B80|nr:nucleic acid/nucleotide deaminase domain-containing protein [Microbacterium sp. zg.B185]
MLRNRFGRENVALEQLFSERIPCGECLPKLERTFNAEIFSSIAKRGSRATDLMRAYGIH